MFFEDGPLLWQYDQEYQRTVEDKEQLDAQY
jgi:hypothetical protein